MQKKEILQKIEELCINNFVGYLATTDENGFPHIRAVENLQNKEYYPELVDFFYKYRNKYDFYFSTFTTSQKYEQIKKNPILALYLHQGHNFFGVSLCCKAIIIEDLLIKKQVWCKKFEYFWKTPTNKKYGLIKLIPYSMKGWTGKRQFNYEINNTIVK